MRATLAGKKFRENGDHGHPGANVAVMKVIIIVLSNISVYSTNN